jgi:hypothetical protein
MAKLVIFGDERTWKRFERCRLVHQLQQNSGKGIRDECSCYIGIQLQTQFQTSLTNPSQSPTPILHVSFLPPSPFQDDLTRDQCAKYSLSSCLHQHPQNFLKSEISLEILILTTNDNDNFSTFITNRQDDEDQQRYVFSLRSVSLYDRFDLMQIRALSAKLTFHQPSTPQGESHARLITMPLPALDVRS